MKYTIGKCYYLGDKEHGCYIKENGEVIAIAYGSTKGFANLKAEEIIRALELADKASGEEGK